MHTPPTIGDIVTFEERVSDTINEPVIAILEQGIFTGWIRRSNLDTMHARLLLDSSLRGTIVYCETRFWP
jgi:hypothetical protein